MAAGLQKFEIILDSSDNTFSPGDIIVGQVIVELGKPKSIRGLKIRFKGKAEAKWSESIGAGKDQTTTWYTNSEDYFRMEFYLLGGVGDSERVEIESGCHVYPFTFTLPHNIPSSFEHFCGNVRYTIKATMDRPWKFDHHTEMSLTVQTPCDLSINPTAKLPIQDEEHTTFGCFPFDMGSMSVTIYIPVTGFAVGEAIETRLAINNNSSSVHVTKIKLQLKQKIKLYANGHMKKDFKIIQKAEKLGPFNKKDVILVGMQVSTAPPSGFPHCSIIDIEYRLIVQVSVSGLHCKVERIYPILIGTIPAFGSQLTHNVRAIPLEPNGPSAPFLVAENSSADKPPPSYNDCVNTQQ